MAEESPEEWPTREMLAAAEEEVADAPHEANAERPRADNLYSDQTAASTWPSGDNGSGLAGDYTTLQQAGFPPGSAGNAGQYQYSSMSHPDFQSGLGLPYTSGGGMDLNMMAAFGPMDPQLMSALMAPPPPPPPSQPGPGDIAPIPMTAGPMLGGPGFAVPFAPPVVSLQLPFVPPPPPDEDDE